MNVFQSPELRYGNVLYEYALSLREISLMVDENSLCINDYFHFPVINFLVSDRDSTALCRTHYLEALSYGDPGSLLACPGPSLSGLMMRTLANPDQINHFYFLLKEKKYRTFFALTEPLKGSDASHIQTQLKKIDENTWSLNGEKSFFGNGAVAEMGIVLAKISDNSLGIRAVLITDELLLQKNISREILPMYALRGAQIACMSFNNTIIPDENILGSHLSACKNSLYSIISVFNQLRTGVGALALGLAQAVFDFVYHLKSSHFFTYASFFHECDAQLSLCRGLLQEAAKRVDLDHADGALASLSKANATAVAENIVERCIALCSVDELMANPWIQKALRDVYCWEFMEGTTHIQKLQSRFTMTGLR